MSNTPIQMTTPNFENYGYRVIEKLSQNLQGGRITYKAVEISTNTSVVIKQFCFATKDWSGYKQVDKEINILQRLEHPGIPRYLNRFDPGDGMCLVQEYKNAQNLALSGTFNSEEIKDIAIQVLEILIYIQSRIPLIVHRDIKPENILVEISPQSLLKKGGGISRELKVYLVDFGFARIGGEVTALSSMVAGTTGFMPPEQLLNKPLTEASDLYGLGATLICLLTEMKSTELGELVDYKFRINYKSLVSQYSLSFIDWLEQMVNPDVSQRFKNAKIALDKLYPLYVIRVPEVQLDRFELEFTAEKVEDKMSQIVTVRNDIPETVLQGKWSVSLNQNYPSHTSDNYTWIQVSPQEFKGNQVQCKVTVDTKKLKTNTVYQREIILRSNAQPENHSLKIRVKIAFPIVVFKKPPYVWLGVICLGTAIALRIVLAIAGVVGWENLGMFSGTILGGLVALARAKEIGWRWALMWALMWVSILCFVGQEIWLIMLAMGDVLSGMIIGIIASATIVMITRVDKKFKVQGFNRGVAWLYILLSSGFGISIGIGKIVGLTPYLVLALAVTGLPLGGMLLYPHLKKGILIAKYRKRELQQDLIKP